MDSFGSSEVADVSPSQTSSSDGETLTVEQAIANLTHPDLSLRYYAAWWLGKFRVSDPAAVDALIAALDDESDRTELGGYPLRRNAARALGKLGDYRAVPGLIACLSCSDFYVREAAAQSLGSLGADGMDAVLYRSCVSMLMGLLEGGVAAAQLVLGRPHLVQPYEAVIEALGDLGAVEAVELIQPFLQHSVQRVHYSAARAMYQLTREPMYGDRLVQALHSSDPNLRRVALSDLGAVGYLPAAEAIAKAPTENSFKLFSLKGILQYHVRTSDSLLSDDAIRVMTLMDAML